MGVGEQVVGQQYRLRGLQVRLAGHDRGGMGGGLGGQRRDHVEHTVGDAADRVTQPHPKQRGHLVVSGTAGPQPAAQVGADPVDQPALERAVHVFVTDQGSEAAVGDVGGQAVQTGQQPVALLGGEQPGPEQHLGVSLGRGDVVGRQYPVEVGRLAQYGKGIRGTVGESAAPQRPLVGAAVVRAHDPARSRRADKLDDRPCTCTKPLAADWSNVSPSS